MKARFLIAAFFFLIPLAAAATEVKEVVTPKKFKVWYVEDHNLPIVSMNISFRGVGSAYDPKGKEGLATLVSSLLNEGAGDMDGIEYRNLLQKKAINLSFTSYRDHFTITIKTLSKNLPDALKLLTLALKEPKFDGDAIDTVRNQILHIIQKKQENPQYIAEQKWLQLVFAGHPYSKDMLGNKKSLHRIEREHLLQYASNSFTRSNIVISAAGDITKSQIAELIDDSFSALPEKQITKRKIKDTKGSFAVHKSTYLPFAVPQAFAVFGTHGVKRDNPDFFPAFVLNYILGGGGFESRLMEEIREKRGLAYSVDTGLEALDHAGFIEGRLATRKEKIDESIKLLKEILHDLQTKGIMGHELDKAKLYLTGSFAIALDSNDKLSNFLNLMQLDNLGRDYLDKRNDYVNAVTKEQVDRVAKNLLNPDNLLIVVVGVEQNPFKP